MGSLVGLLGCAGENNSQLLQSTDNSSLDNPYWDGELPDLSSLQSIKTETERMENRLEALRLQTFSQEGAPAAPDFATLEELELALRNHRESEVSEDGTRTYQSMESLMAQVTEAFQDMEARGEQRGSAYFIIRQISQFHVMIRQAQRALVQISFELNERFDSNPQAIQQSLDEAAELRQRLTEFLRRVSEAEASAKSQAHQIAEHLREHRAVTDQLYTLMAAAAGLARNRTRQRQYRIEGQRLLALYDAAIQEADNFIAKNTFMRPQ